MRIMSLIAVILLLISTVSIASAQEPETAQDNACYAGGSMDGKCTTEWHWTCGWYVARYERGEFSLGQVRSDCALSLIIPYLPPAKAEAAVQQIVQSGYFTALIPNLGNCTDPLNCQIDAFVFQWFEANHVPFATCPNRQPDITTHHTSFVGMLLHITTLIIDPNWDVCFP